MIIVFVLNVFVFLAMTCLLPTLVLFLECDNPIFIGEKGIGKSTGKPLHFKGSQFHRIIKGFMAQVCLF